MNSSILTGSRDGRFPVQALFALGALAVILALEPWLTLPMKWASFCYFLMCAGFFLRKVSRPWHGRLMASAVFGDLALVLLLQAQRGAVQTALSFRLGALQQAHVGFSLLATLLYFPLLVLGWRLVRGGGREEHQLRRKWHRRIGLWAFTFRTLGFLLMFSLLKAAGKP